MPPWSTVPPASCLYCHPARRQFTIDVNNASIAYSTMVIQEIDQEVLAVNRAAEDISGNSHKVEDNANELKRLAHELGALISRLTF